MREINKNTNSLNYSGVQKFDQQKENHAPAPETKGEEQPVSKEQQNLSLMPAAVTGRSLAFKGNPVDNDIKFMMENPEAVGKANKFFDMAEAQCGYETAAKLTNVFVKEFLRD